MPRARTSNLCLAVVPTALFVASTAAGHIELLDPPARYPTTGNKSCPCGEGDSNRRCEVTAEESTDPNRSTDPAKISRFEVGSTITVRFDEYIGHSGRFRVAFDADGADLADFNDHVLGDVADPSDGRGLREMQVTLPDTPCDNCTLQLIQAMHGDTENPVLDPAPLSTYYTCADIELVPAGTLGDGDSEAGSAGDEESADAGMAPSVAGDGEDEDDGGCSIARRPASTELGGMALLGLALGLAWRRRRRVR